MTYPIISQGASTVRARKLSASKQYNTDQALSVIEKELLQKGHYYEPYTLWNLISANKEKQ